MCRNTTKMHTFYTADVQEYHNNAYILYRGCAGIPQKCILSQVVNAEIVDGFLKDVCANNYAEESFSNTFLQQ